MMRSNGLLNMQFFLDLGYRKLFAVFEQVNDHDAQRMGDGPEQLGHFFKLLDGKSFGINIGHLYCAASIRNSQCKSRIKNTDMLKSPLRICSQPGIAAKLEFNIVG